MERNFCKILALVFLLGLTSVALAEDGAPTFYGAFKLSLNSINDGDTSNLTVASNDSRVGIKGDHALPNTEMKLVYQLEMEFDSTERTGFNGGRNTFVGVEGSFGRFLLGQYDTPLKDMRENGAELFDDTIANSRVVLGAANGEKESQLDERAKNAIMYNSPSVNGVQVNVLYSTDADPADEEVVDDNDNDLTSANILYMNGPLYVGFGYEKKSQPAATDDITATRLAFAYNFGTFQIGGVLESADAGDNQPLTRDAMVFNVRYNMSEKTWAGVQVGKVDEHDGSTDTGATNISVGVMHSMDDNTTVYLIATNTNNEDNGEFGLATGGFQDKVNAAEPGDTVTGLSAGVEYKF